MGFKKREGIERIEERYLRWVLGVNRKTEGGITKIKIKGEGWKDGLGI